MAAFGIPSERVRCGLRAAALVLVFGWSAAGQEGGERLSEEQFTRQSLALRTTLHYDASLDSPLDALVKMYRTAGRAAELVTLYQTHVTQYPDDAGAHAVLVRLLQVLKKPEASAMARLGVERHPGSSLLAYLSFRDLDAQRDPRALDELVRAVGLEANAGRRERWVDELVEQAKSEGRDELAESVLRQQAGLEGQRVESLVALAGKAVGGGFAELALEILGKAKAMGAPPELGVEIELLSADAEEAAGDAGAAGERLDSLLTRVAADYWRRPEIVMRRVNLLGSDAAREMMIKEARERYAAKPTDEAAALDLAELLEAAGLRRDALAVLLESAERSPSSERLEKRAVELLDRTGDERRAVAFLEKRTAAQPGRADLGYRYVKALYLTGDREGAEVLVERLFGELKAGERAQQMLDLGRFLRRSSLGPDAAKVFEQVVALLPERLDVRRELAETYVALGRTDEARELFAGGFADGVEIENFLDAVGFLIGEGMLTEARQAVEARLQEEVTNFELWVLMVEIAGKTGDRSTGADRLAGARELVDTGARYARWLETGVQFYELYDEAESFFDGEEGRFGGNLAEWEADKLARFLIFCDAAKRHDRDERLAEVIKERLEAGGVDNVTEVRLRRLLVEVLGRDPNFAVEVQKQLQELVRDDAANRATYQLRLAKMYHGANRPDLARPLLESVDIAAVTETEVLGGTEAVMMEYSMNDRAVEVLARMAQLEPSVLRTWEVWLSLLGSRGDEAGLRRVVRHLLSGGSQTELSDESFEMLRGHLADSYWRSVGRLLVEGGDEVDEVLTLLDAIERVVDLRDDRLWVLWARAHTLGRMGRDVAKGQAVDELVRAVEMPADDGKPGMIYFPDGLALAVEAAVESLRDPGGGVRGGVREVAGPVGEMGVNWIYETRGGAAVVQVLEVAGGVVVVAGDGSVAKLDREGGKLLWERRGAIDVVTSPRRKGGANQIVMRGQRAAVQSRYVNRRELGVVVPAKVTSDGRGRLFVPLGDRVGCLDGDDGRVLWESSTGASLPKMPVPNQQGGAGIAVPPMRLFVDGTRLVVFSPEAGMAAAFLTTNGKVLWEQSLVEADAPGAMPSGLGSGADYSAGMLFVYGKTPAVLDGATGEVVWKFGTGRVREFPVRLEAKGDAGVAGLGAFSGMATSRPKGTNLSYTGAANLHPYYARQFVESGGKLVAPAVQWAKRLEQGEVGHAQMAGRRLLLMDREGVLSLSLDLPLGAMRYPGTGTFVGSCGNKAILLGYGGKELGILNLTKGEVETIALEEVGEVGRPGAIQVAAGGARVYAAGPKGILCVNAHTAGRVFFQEWPELAGMTDEGVEEVAVVAKPGVRVQTRIPTMQYYWQGQAILAGNGLISCHGMVNEVGEGRLYAVVSGNRVVALGEKRHEGEGDGGR